MGKRSHPFNGFLPDGRLARMLKQYERRKAKRRVSLAIVCMRSDKLAERERRMVGMTNPYGRASIIRDTSRIYWSR